MLLCIFYVLISGILFADNAVINEKTQDISQLLKPYLERKCLKNADSKAFTELQETEKEFQSCLSKTPLPKSPNEAYNFMCSVIPQISYDCSESLLEKLEPCLDDEEKYLPDFLLSVFNSSIEKRCEGSEETFKAKLESLKNIECGDVDSLYLVLGVVDNCVRKLISEHYSPELDFVIKKPYFCSKLKNFKDCMIDNLDKVCKDNSFPELVASDFEIVLSWCTKNISEESAEEEDEELEEE